MKFKIIFFGIFLKSFLVLGQENAKICNEYQIKINDFIANEKYDDAEKIIPVVLKSCPLVNEKFYQNAEKIYLHNIEFSKTNDSKVNIINNLIKLYDVYDKKIPENSNKNALKKALYLFDNKLSDSATIYSILDNSFKNKYKEFDNPRALYIYLETYFNEFKIQKNNIKLENLLTRFVIVDTKNIENQKSLIDFTNILSVKQKTTPLSESENINLKSKLEDLQAFRLVKESSKGLIEPYLTCENLKNYCSKYLESNNNNIDWLQFTANAMFEKNCYSNEHFIKISEKLNELKPDSKSKIYLGFSAVLKEDYNKVEKYFNEAADLENNLLEKSNIYTTIATNVYAVNNQQKAVEYLKKATNLNVNNAKPFMLLANMYQTNNKDCFKSEFEKKAINYLIINSLEKAITAEPYLKNALQKQITEFTKKTPTKTEIQESKMNGKTIIFGCFINETLEIPKN